MKPAGGTAGADARWQMISSTARYALRAVIHVAGRGASGPPTSGAAVAAQLGLSEKYLGRVLSTLARAGVLTSVRGVQGGFRLARPIDELTLAEVVTPFERVGAPPRCLLRDRPCGPDGPCAAHGEWHAISERVQHFFSDTTVADLVHGGQAIPHTTSGSGAS